MKSATKENNIFYKAAAKVRILERKIAQMEERNTRLYEDYVAGIVDKDDFDMMKERYIGELQNLREELQVQEQNQRILEKKANRYMDMVNHMEKYLDITPGSVSVMGLMNDHDNAVRLLVDEDVLKGEWVGCHPCINTSSLRIKTKDMFGPVIKAMHHDMTVVKLTGEA